MASCQERVPLSGQKRKACVACIDDNFGDFGPAPSKLCAVDDEVAHKVLTGGFLYDPSNRPPPEQTKVFPMEEDAGGSSYVSYGSMVALPSPPFQKQPGDTIDMCGVTQPQDLDGKECRALVTHSMHASQPISPTSNLDSEALTKKGVTLVLSNEIQETLTLKRLSDDCLLPRLLTSHQSSSNSMMLVEWKPRPTNPLDYFLKHTALGENITNQKKNAQASLLSFPIPNKNDERLEESSSKMDVDVL